MAKFQKLSGGQVTGTEEAVVSASWEADGGLWGPHSTVSPRDNATNSDGVGKPNRGSIFKQSRSEGRSGTWEAFLSIAYRINVTWGDVLINCFSVVERSHVCGTRWRSL